MTVHYITIIDYRDTESHTWRLRQRLAARPEPQPAPAAARQTRAPAGACSCSPDQSPSRRLQLLATGAGSGRHSHTPRTSCLLPLLLGVLQHPVSEELLEDLPVVDLLLDGSGGQQPASQTDPSGQQSVMSWRPDRAVQPPGSTRL